MPREPIERRLLARPGAALLCRFALGIAVTVPLVGCGDSNDSGMDTSTPESVADSLGCVRASELDPMLAPIRGNAATRGLSCEVDGEIVHIFARAPIGDTAGAGFTQGGTVENIRRLLGADDLQATCELATLISEDVFVVGSSSELLADLGLPGEAPIPVSPTVSYLDACTLE